MTMPAAQSKNLINGFNNYCSIAELESSARSSAPAISPVTSVTASSPECVAFTLGMTSGGVTTTIATGC